jgi:hypothetical protein
VTCRVEGSADTSLHIAIVYVERKWFAWLRSEGHKLRSTTFASAWNREGSAKACRRYTAPGAHRGQQTDQPHPERMRLTRFGVNYCTVKVTVPVAVVAPEVPVTVTV